MKKIKLLITILFMIVSFINPEIIRRANADSNPYALINTVYDSEENGYFTNNSYLFGNGNYLDRENYSRKSGYKGGIIESITDVDIYRFTLYSDAQVYLDLLPIQTGATHMEYNFTVYKYNHVVSVNTGYQDVTPIYTSNSLGLTDSYSGFLSANSYAVCVFGVNGAYSNKFSYRLEYEIIPEQKHNININDYKMQNPNSFLIWSSDFNVFESKKQINIVEKYIGNTVGGNSINQDILNNHCFANGFPNLEIYLWGINLRNELHTATNRILTNLIRQRDEMELINEKIRFHTQIIDNIENVEAIIGCFNFDTDEELFNIELSFSNIYTALLFLRFHTLETQNTIPLSNLITSYSVINTALAVGYDTLDSEVVAITQRSFIHDKVVGMNYEFYLSNYFTAFGTNNSNGARLLSNTISDVITFEDSNQLDVDIFGDIYYPNDISLFID